MTATFISKLDKPCSYIRVGTEGFPFGCCFCNSQVAFVALRMNLMWRSLVQMPCVKQIVLHMDVVQ